MMNFHQILEQVATRPETRGNAIGDGQFSCAYSELPSRLDEVTVFLDGKRIGGDECLAVECINSVSGALLLLALWRRGASFVLTPPGVNNETKPTPGFCRYKLTVRHGAPLSAADSIQVESNPDFNGEKIPAGKLLLRTSGSIGASKIVVHDQLKLIGNAGNCVRKYNFNPASRAVIPVPVAHMYGFGAEFLPAILAGASIDLQEKTNVLTYLDREKRFRPTIAFVTPAICEMLLKAYKTPRTHYDVMVTSGQRIGEDVFRALDPLLGGRLVNQYGSTEMGATAACDPGEPLDLRVTSIGKPMEGVELRLEEADSGELLCRHPFGFEGYLDESGQWLHKAEPDGWYRTGDLARVQPDGSMVVVGRADDRVNRSGYLVLLSDVERVLEKFEPVGKAAVVAGKTEARRGERIVAFCVLRAGSEASGPQIRQRCFDVLPHYAIPDEVRVTSSLPMLPGGKIDRQSLAALA